MKRDEARLSSKRVVVGKNEKTNINQIQGITITSGEYRNVVTQQDIKAKDSSRNKNDNTVKQTNNLRKSINCDGRQNTLIANAHTDKMINAGMSTTQQQAASKPYLSSIYKLKNKSQIEMEYPEQGYPSANLKSRSIKSRHDLKTLQQ